nr:hypothetical protein [uncultured Gellertiella sp.]
MIKHAGLCGLLVVVSGLGLTQAEAAGNIVLTDGNGRQTSLEALKDVGEQSVSTGLSVGLGGSASVDWATSWGAPVRVTWDGFVGGVETTRTSTLDLGGQSVFSLTLGDTSGGSIALNTHSGAGGASADGQVLLHPASPDGASIVSSASSPSGSGSSVVQYAFTKTDTGGVFLALATDGDTPSAIAFGSYADEHGLNLIGAGDLGGTTLTRRNTGSFDTARSRILVSMPVGLDADWQISPLAGPVYQLIHATLESSVSLDPGEPALARAVLPTVTLSQSDASRLQYAGLVAGLDVERRLTDRLSMGLALSAGPARYWGTRSRQTDVTYAGLQTVNLSASQTGLDGNALMADISASLTYRWRPDMALHTEAGLGLLSTLSGEARPTGHDTTLMPRVALSFDMRF